MSADTPHTAYAENIEIWRKCRDVAGGQETVHAAGETYLPKLGGQDREEYWAYKARAGFLNATGRTVDGLSGMVFRKEPTVNVPGGMDDFRQDVDQAGKSFLGFAECVLEEVIKVGRAGMLVDFPRMEGEQTTQAQAEAAGLRPYVKLYLAENIIDWRTGQVANRTQLVQVRLSEKFEEAVDEFTDKTVEQIRVLELAGSAYQQRVLREDSDGEWVEVDRIEPRRNGARLTHIPFHFVGPRDNSWEVSKPPLLDLVNVNLQHYMLNADYRHGLHFVALPTPYGTGLNNEDIEKGRFGAIGPTSFWASTSPESSFGMLEYTGAGLQSLERALENLKHDMAVLGARMLETEKRQAEAAETAEIHRAGEQGVLASIALAVSDVLTKVLEEVQEWMRIGGEVSVELNHEFSIARVGAQELTALVQALQGGAISNEAFFYNLKKGDRFPDGWTFEEEQESRDNAGGALGLLGREPDL